MARPRKLPVGTCLHNDTDGLAAIVVESAVTSPEWALVEAVTAYHGGPATVDNPVIREVARGVRIRKWFYCTEEWLEFEGVGDEGYPSWWAENGDGKTFIWVADLSDIDVFDVGDRAAEGVRS